jgi:hypothetical protein
MISRREEWMASECLFTGAVKCLDGDTGEIVAELSYGTPSKVVPTKLWSDPTSDPLADIRGALRLVSNACGASADIVIMGRNAADAFESNQQVLQAYDKLRISPGQLSPESVSWGVQSLGTYRGIPLYVSESEYRLDEALRACRQRPDRREFARRDDGLRGRRPGQRSGIEARRLRGPQDPDYQLRTTGGLQKIPPVVTARACPAEHHLVELARRPLTSTQT